MEWLLAHAEHLTALFGLIAAAWAFLMKVDRGYRKHLKTDLVSKREFAELKEQTDRVESKVDQLVELAFYRARRQRVGRTRQNNQTKG